MSDMGKADTQKVDALAGHIAEFVGATLVTRYVVVAEALFEDGSFGLVDFHSPKLPYWMMHGMLQATMTDREHLIYDRYTYEDYDEDDDDSGI